jgi:hypothetical protein
VFDTQNFSNTKWPLNTLEMKHNAETAKSHRLHAAECPRKEMKVDGDGNLSHHCLTAIQLKQFHWN